MSVGNIFRNEAEINAICLMLLVLLGEKVRTIGLRVLTEKIVDILEFILMEPLNPVLNVGVGLRDTLASCGNVERAVQNMLEKVMLKIVVPSSHYFSRFCKVYF